LCQAFNEAQGRVKNLRGLLSEPKGITSNYSISSSGDHFDPQNNHSLIRQSRGISMSPENAVDRAALDAANQSEQSHVSLLTSAADFSVVKSGTSTLEAGLAGNPMCVVYRGSWASYTIAHMLVNIPVFSLVNIVLGKYVVPELLQGDVNPQRIAQEIERGLTDERYREQQKSALAELPRKLGGPGASQRAAQGIIDCLRGRE